MPFNPEDIAAIFLTLKLAAVSTIGLLVMATPIAHWLARSHSKLSAIVSSSIALPLVLPPTVIGFYLLIAMAETGPIGQINAMLGLPSLAFSFTGLVIGSMIYSLPFMVLPIQNAIEAVDRQLLEAAATLGAGPLDRFFTVTLPLAKNGFIAAIVLGFAHTIGEFGIVLMIGGNIPGETQVLSVLLYERVEAFDYSHAHRLALSMLAFAFLSLLALQLIRGARQSKANPYV